MAILERTIQRANGSEVRLCAQAYYGTGLHLSIGVDVHHRDAPDQPWKLASDRPHPNWRAMPREEYIRHGRAEKFQVASHGEILKTAQMLRTHLGLQ